MKRTSLISYKEFVKKYKSYEWEKIGDWKISNLPYSLFASAVDRKFYEFYGVPCEPLHYLFIRSEAYTSKKEWQEVYKFFIKKIEEKNYKFFNLLIEKQRNLYLETQKLSKEVVRSERLEAIEKVFDSIILLCASFEFDRVFSVILEEKLEERLKELKLTNIYLPQLLEENNESDSGKLHFVLTEIKKRVEKGSLKKDSVEFKKEIKKLIEKYEYLGTYLFTGVSYTEKDFVNMFDKIKPIVENKKIVFQDKLLIQLVDLLNIFSKNKFRRIEVINRSLFVIQPILIKMAEKGNLSWKTAKQFYVDEFMDYIKSGYKNNISKTGFKTLNMIAEKDMQILSEDDTIKFEKEFVDTKSKIINEFNGVIAFHGIIRGIVKVVLSFDDFGKFQDDDVLVCSMTDPNFVPLMKKASAIITDTGGILCHAAIISRELGIPCIIGTKIATQVLKDGDLVEVDADRGIVRIIK